jgi:hypothetical protein
MGTVIQRIVVLLGFALAAQCSFGQFDKPVPAPTEQGWNPDTTFPPLAPAEAMKTIGEPRGEAGGHEWRRCDGPAHGVY